MFKWPWLTRLIGIPIYLCLKLMRLLNKNKVPYYCVKFKSNKLEFIMPQLLGIKWYEFNGSKLFAEKEENGQLTGKYYAFLILKY